ncbi:hypothetical protein QJS04_geneDACA001009 [Acorus gramineus]|uniref:Uncharacterized protein n=1 Tax=Acorus gramineus TaxID=55184 RepID=A0AAV9AAX6_ACOGR|nr:hypothetical protein QJS04_geneDACA001009 [Acorus gramineus]
MGDFSARAYLSSHVQCPNYDLHCHPRLRDYGTRSHPWKLNRYGVNNSRAIYLPLGKEE